MTDRYNQGWEQLKAIDGRQGENVVNSLAAIAPDISKYIIEFVFGEIYMLEDFDLKQRELTTLACLTSLGDCSPSLTFIFMQL